MGPLWYLILKISDAVIQQKVPEKQEKGRSRTRAGTANPSTLTSSNLQVSFISSQSFCIFTYIYHSKPHANRVCGHWVTSGYSPSQSKPSEPGLFLSLHQLHRTGRSQNLNKLLLNEVIVVITVNQRSRHCPILTVECRILAIFIVLSFMWVTNETALHPVFLLSQFSCMLIMPTPIDYYYIAGTPVSTDRLTLQQLQNVLLLHTFLITVLLAYRMLALDPESSISKCVFQLLDLQGLFVNICLVSVFSPQDISSIISSYPP